MENLEDVLNPNQPNDNKPLEENNGPIVDDLDDDIGGNLNINGEIDRKNPDGVPKNLSAQDNQRPNPHGKRPEDVRAPQNNNIVNNQNNQNNNNNNIVNDQNNQNNNNNNNNDNIVNNPNNQNNNNNNPGGEEINNNQNNGNGNNGEAGDRNEENREVDRRQQEANPNNEIDDVELGENENVIRRSNSFVGRNENNRRRQVNYNPLAPDEAVLDELPDIGKETRLVTDALAKERERLRKERERIEIEKARLKVERAKLEEEKKKLAAAQAKKKSTNTKYKKTIKSDEKTAEKRGYKIGEIKDGVTRSQSKKVNGLKHLVMDMDKKFRSSPKYRGVKSSLKEFDEFMKSISGRTRLTSAEMEMYDKLSLKCYNATTTYLSKKVDERTVDIDSEEAKDAIDVNGEKLSPKNEHERVRITQAKEIKNSLDEMRKEMFKAQLDFKTKEMEKKCQNALEQEEKNRGDLLTNKMSDEELKTAMTESVAKTLFYSTRMDHLKKSGQLDLNTGESFVNGFKRLDKLTEPRPQDMAQNSEDPNFQKIVQAGVDAIKSGKAFTGENIKEMFKQQAIEESNKKIEEKRRVENMKNPAEIKKNENERQLQNPHP